MKKNLTNKAMIVLAVFALIGFGMDAYAFGKGQGYGCQGQSQAQGYGCAGQGQAQGYGCPRQARGQGQGYGCPRQGQGRGCGRAGQNQGRGYGCQDKSACWSALGEEEIAKLDELRQAFFKDNQDLRREINAKELELAGELAKKDPDPGKSASLQEELSGLEARFDQKRLTHILEMKKINPNAGGGCAGRGKKAGGGCPFR